MDPAAEPSSVNNIYTQLSKMPQRFPTKRVLGLPIVRWTDDASRMRHTSLAPQVAPLCSRRFLCGCSGYFNFCFELCQDSPFLAGSVLREMPCQLDPSHRQLDPHASRPARFMVVLIVDCRACCGKRLFVPTSLCHVADLLPWPCCCGGLTGNITGYVQ